MTSVKGLTGGELTVDGEPDEPDVVLIRIDRPGMAASSVRVPADELRAAIDAAQAPPAGNVTEPAAGETPG